MVYHRHSSRSCIHVELRMPPYSFIAAGGYFASPVCGELEYQAPVPPTSGRRSKNWSAEQLFPLLYFLGHSLLQMTKNVKEGE